MKTILGRIFAKNNAAYRGEVRDAIFWGYCGLVPNELAEQWHWKRDLRDTMNWTFEKDPTPRKQSSGDYWSVQWSEPNPGPFTMLHHQQPGAPDSAFKIELETPDANKNTPVKNYPPDDLTDLKFFPKKGIAIVRWGGLWYIPQKDLDALK